MNTRCKSVVGISALTSVVAIALSGCVPGEPVSGSFSFVENTHPEVVAELSKIMAGSGLTGVNDPRRTNQEINEQVANLLFSYDPSDVNKGLRELGEYVSYVRKNSKNNQNPPVLRTFDRIPGFKQVLLLHFRKGVEDSGGEVPLFQPPREIDPSEELELLQDPLKFKEFVNNEVRPAWMDIPAILAVVFPEDADVHDLIWEAHDPVQPGATLASLDLGRYATPRATKYRRSILFSYHNDWSHFWTIDAARGLGLCQSDEAFDALLRRLKQPYDELLGSFIVEAIVAYGPRALTYRDLVREVAERFRATSNSDNSAALRRLHEALKNLDSLAESYARLNPSSTKKTANAELGLATESNAVRVAGSEIKSSSEEVQEVLTEEDSGYSRTYLIAWNELDSPRKEFFTLEEIEDGHYRGAWTDRGLKTYEVRDLKIDGSKFSFSYKPYSDVDLEWMHEGTLEDDEISGRQYLDDPSGFERTFTGQLRSEEFWLPESSI